MKKILISIFFAFYLAKNIYGASPQQLTSEAFLELITADGTIEIEQEIIHNIPIGIDSGYFTKGLSPCFCFVFFDKETGKTLFMTHFGPRGSEASTKKAKNYIESYLDSVLAKLEANCFASDSEEEEDDEQHPLYESISIWVIGGKEADSGNSIAALREIAEEQYFPVDGLFLNIAAPNQVLDVYSKDQENTFFHLAELAEEQNE